LRCGNEIPRECSPQLWNRNHIAAFCLVEHDLINANHHYDVGRLESSWRVANLERRKQSKLQAMVHER